MSTRATYHFKATSNQTAPITFYIHHDGYPAGAAHYAASMLALDNQRGGWACMFLRANDGAEITSGHDDHGDTEFRYDFNQAKQTVRAWKVSADRTFDNRPFIDLGEFDICEFIAKHAEWESTPREFAKCNGRYVTKEKALAYVRDRLAYAQAAYFQGWTGNSAGALDEVRRHDALLIPNERNICNALDAALKVRFAA